MLYIRTMPDTTSILLEFWWCLLHRFTRLWVIAPRTILKDISMTFFKRPSSTTLKLLVTTAVETDECGTNDAGVVDDEKMYQKNECNSFGGLH